MRIRRSRVKTFYLRKTLYLKDREGNSYKEYESAVELSGEIWPANGKAQSEMYGKRLNYIMNVKIDGKYSIVPDTKGILHYKFDENFDIVEGDALCIFVPKESKPDYEIISVKPYKPLRIEVERIDHRS